MDINRIGGGMNYVSMRMLAFVIFLCAGMASSADSAYDPLKIIDTDKVTTVDMSVTDKDRDREIPIRVYLPKKTTPAPVVLFSHGLGGSREGNVYMGEHWASRGYIAVFLQHPGSDTSVWKDKPAGQRMTSMQDAAGLQNFMLRVKDVPAVIDQLDAWNKSEGHVLCGRMDMKKIGMSGHSFGAVTTQGVSGQSTARGNISFTDQRIKAAMAFSPSSPNRGDPAKAFGNVKIPWMLMTGTKDVSVIGNADVESRLAVFPALPSGGKYEVVLDGAEHSAFTDKALPGDTEARNPNHHKAILALSTAFWDAWLCEDAAARKWLDGSGPRSILEKDDRWQKK